MAQRARINISEKEQPATQPPTQIILKQPVIVALDESKSSRRRGRKRTSSRGSRRLADIDKRVSKAVRRVTRAVDHGIDSYIDHRNRSAERRQDGVITDFGENVAYGVSQAISEGSPVIHDVAEAFNTRRMRQQVRRLARSFASIPFIG